MTQLIKPKAPEPTQEPEPGSGEEPEVEEFKPLPASDYQEVCNLKNIEDKVRLASRDVMTHHVTLYLD